MIWYVRVIDDEKVISQYHLCNSIQYININMILYIQYYVKPDECIPMYMNVYDGVCIDMKLHDSMWRYIRAPN